MPSMIRVCVAGATGRVGRGLVRAIADAPDLDLVAAIARRDRGADVGTLLADPRLAGVRVTTLDNALAAGPNVLVDYTRANAAKHHVLTALVHRVHVVIGTSGLTDEDYAVVDATARAHGVGAIAAGNFALTAVLLGRFATEAARAIPQWEIVDYAGADKADAPSGTARELAHRLAHARAPVVARPIAETIGAPESRGATVNGAQLHSVRLPGFVSAVEVTFGLLGERLILRHESLDATLPYIGGTLLAIRAAPRQLGLVRGLDSLL